MLPALGYLGTLKERLREKPGRTKFYYAFARTPNESAQKKRKSSELIRERVLFRFLFKLPLKNRGLSESSISGRGVAAVAS